MTTAFALLKPLKTNLGIVADVYDEQLLLLLRNAQDAITREGVTLTGSAEDDTLTIQYAAWTWRERRKGDLRGFSKVMITLCMIGDCILIGFFVLMSFFLEARWYMGLCCFFGGVLAVWLLFMLLAHRLSKKSVLVWLCCALPVLGVLVGVPLYDGYLDRITLAEEFNYRTYEPFRLAGLQVDAVLADDALPRMDGATALYPVYAAFCQAVYPESLGEMDYWTEYHRVITCSTTSGAYKAIVEGERDIIFVAGPSEEQEAYAAERGVELVYTPIGREAFVLFVHPDNPVEGLTLD